MLVIIYTLHDGIFLSITHFSRHVEAHLQVGGGGNPLCQLQLGPAELSDRPDVPCVLLESQFCLQNDHVLGPADGHGLCHHFRGIFVGAVEIPHPAQVSGGKAGNIRVCVVQVLRCGHRRAHLRSAADQAADFTVQLHLRQGRCYQLAQCGV